MIYSNLSSTISSTRISRNGKDSYYLNYGINLGNKIKLCIFCPAKARIEPKLNEDLNFHFAKSGDIYLEKHVPNWMDDDPYWNCPEQLFLLLFGKGIQTRLCDENIIRRHASVIDDDCSPNQYTILEVKDIDNLHIIKVQKVRPQDKEYIVIGHGNQIVQSFSARNNKLLKENAEKLEICFSEFKQEWIEIL